MLLLYVIIVYCNIYHAYIIIFYTHIVFLTFILTHIYSYILLYPYHNSNPYLIPHTQISSHFPTSAVTGLSLLAQLDKVEREQEKAGRADLQVTYSVCI